MPQTAVDKETLLDLMHYFGKAFSKLEQFPDPNQRGFKTAKKGFDKRATKLFHRLAGGELTEDDLHYIWTAYKPPGS